MSLSARQHRKKDRHLCQQCAVRKALYRAPRTGKYKAATNGHDLCLQCWRSTQDQTALAEANEARFWRCEINRALAHLPQFPAPL